MAGRRQLGEILLESGRIDQTEVDRVLDYQRTNGGFFGQGVVALGIMSAEEIDWALASQFDLPFIFPNAAAVDREAAALVAADWALAHLAVPIVKAGRTLTVVVADPLDNATLDELAARTGLEVEMALASASRIRELIRTIYGETMQPREDVTPDSFTGFMRQAFESGASRIGISVRAGQAMGWFQTADGRGRTPLMEGWATLLEDMLDPSPFDMAGSSKGGVSSYEATLSRGGSDTVVDVQVSFSDGGSEFLLQPRRAAPSRRATTVTLPPSVAAELRLIARSTQARVAMPGGGDDVAHDLLPQLPILVFGGDVRSAHVGPVVDVPGIFSIRPEGDFFVNALEAYAFDAITVDMPAGDDRIGAVMSTAPISFAYFAGTPDRAALERAGINWLLTVSRDRDSLVWELRPMAR
jgi:hypothetical protein